MASAWELWEQEQTQGAPAFGTPAATPGQPGLPEAHDDDIFDKLLREQDAQDASSPTTPQAAIAREFPPWVSESQVKQQQPQHVESSHATVSSNASDLDGELGTAEQSRPSFSHWSKSGQMRNPSLPIPFGPTSRNISRSNTNGNSSEEDPLSLPRIPPVRTSSGGSAAAFEHALARHTLSSSHPSVTDLERRPFMSDFDRGLGTSRLSSQSNSFAPRTGSEDALSLLPASVASAASESLPNTNSLAQTPSPPLPALPPGPTSRYPLPDIERSSKEDTCDPQTAPSPIIHTPSSLHTPPADNDSTRETRYAIDHSPDEVPDSPEPPTPCNFDHTPEDVPDSPEPPTPYDFQHSPEEVPESPEPPTPPTALASPYRPMVSLSEPPSGFAARLMAPLSSRSHVSDQSQEVSALDMGNASSRTPRSAAHGSTDPLPQQSPNLTPSWSPSTDALAAALHSAAHAVDTTTLPLSSAPPQARVPTPLASVDSAPLPTFSDISETQGSGGVAASTPSPAPAPRRGLFGLLGRATPSPTPDPPSPTATPSNPPAPIDPKILSVINASLSCPQPGTASSAPPPPSREVALEALRLEHARKNLTQWLQDAREREADQLAELEAIRGAYAGSRSEKEELQEQLESLHRLFLRSLQDVFILRERAEKRSEASGMLGKPCTSEASPPPPAPPDAALARLHHCEECLEEERARSSALHTRLEQLMSATPSAASNAHRCEELTHQLQERAAVVAKAESQAAAERSKSEGLRRQLQELMRASQGHMASFATVSESLQAATLERDELREALAKAREQTQADLTRDVRSESASPRDELINRLEVALQDAFESRDRAEGALAAALRGSSPSPRAALQQHQQQQQQHVDGLASLPTTKPVAPAEHPRSAAQEAWGRAAHAERAARFALQELLQQYYGVAIDLAWLEGQGVDVGGLMDDSDANVVRESSSAVDWEHVGKSGGDAERTGNNSGIVSKQQTTAAEGPDEQSPEKPPSRGLFGMFGF